MHILVILNFSFLWKAAKALGNKEFEDSRNKSFVFWKYEAHLSVFDAITIKW